METTKWLDKGVEPYVLSSKNAKPGEYFNPMLEGTWDVTKLVADKDKVKGRNKDVLKKLLELLQASDESPDLLLCDLAGVDRNYTSKELVCHVLTGIKEEDQRNMWFWWLCSDSKDALLKRMQKEFKLV